MGAFLFEIFRRNFPKIFANFPKLHNNPISEISGKLRKIFWFLRIFQNYIITQFRKVAESYGKLRKGAENFPENFPKFSEIFQTSFHNFPQLSTTFRNFPKNRECPHSLFLLCDFGKFSGKFSLTPISLIKWRFLQILWIPLLI